MSTAEQIDEILAKAKGTRFLSLWDERLDEPHRRQQYIAIAREVGVRYAKCTFESYEATETSATGRLSQAEALRTVQVWAESLPNEKVRQGGGLVLTGRPGTGKDHLMIAALYVATFQHGIPAKWIDGLSLIAKCRAALDGSANLETILRQFCQPMILAISDPVPPKGAATEFTTEIFQRIIDRRYRMNKSTWVTLNVRNQSEANERLATPLVSRLRDNSLCIFCDWEDHRRAAK